MELRPTQHGLDSTEVAADFDLSQRQHGLSAIRFLGLLLLGWLEEWREGEFVEFALGGVVAESACLCEYGLEDGETGEVFSGEGISLLFLLFHHGFCLEDIELFFCLSQLFL